MIDKKKIMDEIDEDNRIYLDEIAEKLFSNQAVVMIGAGFSKNARPNSPNCSKFSTWDELGCSFYKKLHGVMPSEDEHYLDVLKLASEVEAAFGRPVLNQLIKQGNPDMNYSPSDLHIKLLELPWVDVFTTNYDTLLERTSKELINQNYKTIVEKEDLVFSQKPRIIKLHGSFPSKRPFIITEEDFRTYPTVYAPFVNTVQQSLLENTMVLIGFSGDDPNFLKWIGWMRDNLGKNTPKIYLVGAFDFNNAQLKLFDKRNITVINLKTNSENKHYTALNNFIEYLTFRKEQCDTSIWSNGDNFWHCNEKIFEDEKNLQDVTDYWKQQRENYPGWVVLPLRKRNEVFHSTKSYINSVRKKSKTIEKIKYDFLYELLWRMEKCFYPIDLNFAEIIEKVISTHINEAKTILFLFSLLKCYRQNGQQSKWKETLAKLENLKLKCTSEELAELHYEKCLFALFSLDYKSLRDYLKNWKLESSLPFYSAKKAGVLAEIGDVEQSISILKQAIIDVRRLQNNSQSSKDIPLLSQESYILYLYQSVWFSSPSEKRLVENKPDYEHSEKEYTKRLKELRFSECDPIEEGDYFKNSLYQDFSEIPKNETHLGFDINDQSTIYHFSGDIKEYRKAYSFLIFLETIASPISVHEYMIRHDIFINETKASIKRIANHSLYWCISLCCRASDEKIVDNLFNRENIGKWSSEYCSELCSNLIDILNENYDQINKNIENYELSNFAVKLANVLPEIISRLCTRSSFEVNKKVLQLICDIYSSNNHHLYRNKSKLIERLLPCFTLEEQEQLLNKILCIEIPKNLSEIEERDIIIPSDYLSRNINKAKTISISSEIVSKYIDLLKSEVFYIKFWAIEALNFLLEIDCLKQNDTEKLFSAMWDRTDDFGLPLILSGDFLKCNLLLNYKQIEQSEIVPLFKNYLMNFVMAKKIGMKEFNIFINELTHSFEKLSFEESELNEILNYILTYMDNCIKKSKKSIYDVNDKHNLVQIRRALVLLYNNFHLPKELLQEVIEKFNLLGIPNLELFFTIADYKELNDCETIISQNLVKNYDDSLLGNSILYDTLYAIDAINRKSDELKEIKENVNRAFCSFLLFNRTNNYNSAINHLLRLLKSDYFILSDFIYAQLLNILNSLLSDTSINNSNSTWLCEDRINIRVAALRLAYFLYNRNKKNGKKQPKVLLDWKAVSESDDEFSEVKIQWQITSE